MTCLSVVQMFFPALLAGRHHDLQRRGLLTWTLPWYIYWWQVLVAASRLHENPSINRRRQEAPGGITRIHEGTGLAHAGRDLG